MEKENWRSKYKGMEQSWMHLKDQYTEVAIALGFKGVSWFGDPLADHAEIVARAKELTTHRTQLLQEIEGEVEVLKDAELIAAAGTRGFGKETRIYLEAITDVITIIRNKLKR